jgi:hypothetical protein
MRRLFLCVLILCSIMFASLGYGQNAPRNKPRAKATPCPGVNTINDCPDEGCGKGHDPDLNKKKNLPSDEQESVLRSISWMKTLRDPRHFTAKNRKRDELKRLGEGEKITVVAWALAARKGGQESCNCKLKAKADTDNHIVLVDPAIDDPTLVENEKRDSETAEFTPRVRLTHPNLTQESLEPLIDPEWRPQETPKDGKLLVRITGLLMFDSEHFLKNHLKRHNNWEIHPVLKLEYCAEGKTCQADSDENWVDLASE